MVTMGRFSGNSEFAQKCIEKGEKVGEILVYKDNVEIDRVPLVAQNDVGKANVFDRFRDVANSWNKRK